MHKRSAAVEISSWPLQKAEDRAKGETKDFLAKCLVGCFNDPFNSSPNSEVIKKWFLTRWKVTAGLIAHNKFLFELPSKQEAASVKAGDWYWNGKRLSLDWWSPKYGSSSMTKESRHKWVKAFGIPLHGWTTDSFIHIGELCGGYINMDENTKNRSHFYWARICVQNKFEETPKELDLMIEGVRFNNSILEDQPTRIIVDG